MKGSRGGRGLVYDREESQGVAEVRRPGVSSISIVENLTSQTPTS